MKRSHQCGGNVGNIGIERSPDTRRCQTTNPRRVGMHLVTGGAGFIGSHLVDALVSRGESVRVLDNLSSGRIEFLKHHSDRDVEVVVGDLLDLDLVSRSMDGVDVVHHLAANPDIRLGIEVTDTDLKQGTLATYNVLEGMRKSGVSKISFSSSSAVYGEANEMPTPESYGPTLPISLYGASKLASEALITAWAGTFGTRAWIHRFANIVGPRGTHGVIYDFIHKLRKDPTALEVLGDGRQEKSYMGVADTVEAMLHVIGLDHGGTALYNLGTHQTVSVTKIAKIVMEAAGLQEAGITYTGGDRGWAGDVPKTWLNVDKLYSSGFQPEMNSEEAVRWCAESLISEIGL